MGNHLRHCVSRAVRTGGSDAEATYDELIDLIYTTSR
jgi:DNA-binding FrmR family transcriptional regulator